MPTHVALVSLPGLRPQDLAHMPRLQAIAEAGQQVSLQPSFPCVTLPVQANLVTGCTPQEHGVIANGYYYRDKGEFEMWTAWNESIQKPQIWDLLHEKDPAITSLLWFPMFSKGAGADYISTPAPIHNPDGSESLWCYTKPTEMYGELRDTFGHFPLMNFWGPLANIKSSAWIIDSAVHAAKKYQPRFSYIYVTHLDYAAQKFGPDSPQAITALGEVDEQLGKLFDGYAATGMDDLLWLIASEYVITEVDEVGYPNRVLREAGYLSIEERDDGEWLVPGESRAWALVDHQLAHVFVKNEADIPAVADLLRNDPSVESVSIGGERGEIGLNHERSGEIVLISKPNAWFAYYYWLDDAKAPGFAHTVDIHRKPGYDPVEMFIDMPAKKTPLDATLVKGSHGYPARDPSRHGVLIASQPNTVNEGTIKDVEVTPLIMNQF